MDKIKQILSKCQEKTVQSLWAFDFFFFFMLSRNLVPME